MPVPLLEHLKANFSLMTVDSGGGQVRLLHFRRQNRSLSVGLKNTAFDVGGIDISIGIGTGIGFFESDVAFPPPLCIQPP